MKKIILMVCFSLTSCASLTSTLLRPVITIENHTTNETKHIQEDKVIHQAVYNIEVKETSKLSQVPEMGIGEKKIYFYPAP